MVKRSKSEANDCLCYDARGNAARGIRGLLESLLQEGYEIDTDDCESVQEWINAIFRGLESFPSEHRSLRLHCHHIGLALLSIALEKANEHERQAFAGQIASRGLGTFAGTC